MLPPMLEAVGVLNVDIDPQGAVKRIHWTRAPRHVPQEVFFVADLPRTFNGKLAEIAATDLANQRPVRNLASLANPECLSELAKFLFKTS